MGPAFVCLLRKVRRKNFQPILQNAFCVLIAPQSLACQKFPDVEKQVIITCCKFVLYRECSKILHLNSSSNSLTISDMPSCIVVRYPFHVYAFLFSSVLSVSTVPLVTVALQFVTNVFIKWYNSWSSFLQPSLLPSCFVETLCSAPCYNSLLKLWSLFFP